MRVAEPPQGWGRVRWLGPGVLWMVAAMGSGELLFTPEARRHQYTRLEKTGDRTWTVSQTLLDPQGDNLWAAEGEIDLRDRHAAEGPLVRLLRIEP